MRTILLSSLFLGACTFATASTDGSYDSTAVETSRLIPAFSIQSDGTTAVVRAAYFGKRNANEENKDLRLTGADALSVTLDGTTVPLVAETNPGDVIHYVTSIPQPTDRKEFRIALTRQTSASAPNSTIVLPAGFAMSTPAYSTATKHLTLALSPVPSDSVTVEVSAPCIDLRTTSNHNNGVVDVDLSTAKFTSATSCLATVSVKAVTYGKQDAAYSGVDSGVYSMQGEQRRTATFQISQ